jgi:hypothetical protein
MLLPEFTIPSKVNQVYTVSGIDSLDKCRDKNHFNNYPKEITYYYNSRGYRDQEWPSDLASAIWCIGDSYTAGIGAPVEHTWPYLLKKNLSNTTVNISLDGASNNWIARKAQQVLIEIKPATLVLHWSFINRREESLRNVQDSFWKSHYNNLRDPKWPAVPDVENVHTLPEHIYNEVCANGRPWLDVGDDNRLVHFLVDANEQQDIDNTVGCIKNVDSLAGNTQIIHSFISDFAPNVDSVIDCLELRYMIPPIKQLDFGRDGYHYGIQTATVLANKIAELLDK